MCHVPGTGTRYDNIPVVQLRRSPSLTRFSRTGRQAGRPRPINVSKGNETHGEEKWSLRRRSMKITRGILLPLERVYRPYFGGLNYPVATATRIR